MACAYTLSSGKPSLCFSTSGPGALNMVNAAMLSYQLGIPVMFVSGLPHPDRVTKGVTQDMKDLFGQVKIFEQVVKKAFYVSTASYLSSIIPQVFNAMFSGRPGPVHLSVSNTVWSEKISCDAVVYRCPSLTAPLKPTLRAAARVLISASHPVILVGNGVRMSNTSAVVTALSESLDALTVTTLLAKGVVSEDNRRHAGCYGLGGQKAASEAISIADTILVLGSSLSEMETNLQASFQENKILIQIDVDPSRLFRRYSPQFPIVSSLQLALPALLKIVNKELSKHDNEVRSTLNRWERCNLVPGSSLFSRFEDEESYNSEAVPLHPARLRKDLQEVIPDNVIVLADPSGAAFFNFHYLKITGDQKHFGEIGWASMGQMTAGAVGVALAFPNRPVICVVGDGCFAMNGFEVGTAVRYNLKIIWIVECNEMQAMCRWGELAITGSEAQLEHTLYGEGTIQAAKIGQGMGAFGAVVEKPGHLQKVIAEALVRDGPTVIEARVDPQPPVGMQQRISALSLVHV
ncbi:thiamine pyrophosphate-binding protein [Pelomyxa schiedti]|nr:thiamine pyrophosphate-binding protein [Pelomyxa schiedti]